MRSPQNKTQETTHLLKHPWRTALILPLLWLSACQEPVEGGDPTPTPTASPSQTPSPGQDLDHDGITALDGDCNNFDSSIHPDAFELMDEKDNDCDGLVDEGTGNADADGDGYFPSTGDCDEADPAIHPGQPDPVDGVDNDCDGKVDELESEQDLDGDGYSPSLNDCDDTNANIHPSQYDALDGVDADCDGFIDEDVPYGGEPSVGTVSALTLDAAAGAVERKLPLAEDQTAAWSEVADVQWVGDLDDDGYDDMTVSVIETDFTGKVFLIYGGEQLLEGKVPLEQRAHAVFVSEVSPNILGLRVLGRGDLDGDDVPDLLIADPFQQRILLYRGGPRRSGEISSRDADAVFSGYSSGAYPVGYSLDIPGDIDGDGYLDILIGQPAHDTFSGRVFLVKGGRTFEGIIDLADADAVIEGVGFLEGAGSTCGGAGDLNGDGLADFFIAAPTGELVRPTHSYGVLHLYYGSKTRFQGPLTLDESDAHFTSSEGAAPMVFAHGDFDGDALEDAAIGLPWRRQVFLIYGRTEAFSGARSLEHSAETLVQWSGQEGNHYYVEQYDFGFGASLSLASDFNADGRRDLVVGVPSSHAWADYLEWDFIARLEPGYVAIFPGRSDRPVELRTKASRSLEVRGQGHFLERVCPVAVGGDGNGDGQPDLLVSGQNAQQTSQSWNATYLYEAVVLPP